MEFMGLEVAGFEAMVLLLAAAAEGAAVGDAVGVASCRSVAT